jgi:hypothetical protein
MRNKATMTRTGKAKSPNKSNRSLMDLVLNKLSTKAQKEKAISYLHVSKTFKTVNGKTVFSTGSTYDIGRNKQKRLSRNGQPRKHWPFLNNR